MTKPNHRFLFIPDFLLVLLPLLLLLGLKGVIYAQTLQADIGSDNPLRQLSLEQLGNIEVTTASKAPEEAWKTPSAAGLTLSSELLKVATKVIGKTGN